VTNLWHLINFITTKNHKEIIISTNFIHVFVISDHSLHLGKITLVEKFYFRFVMLTALIDGGLI